MAGHADLGGRKPSERRFLHRIVTVATIDPVAADMRLVNEGQRLLDNGCPDAERGHIGRLAPDEVSHDQQDEPYHPEAEDQIETGLEYLGHRLMSVDTWPIAATYA